MVNSGVSGRQAGSRGRGWVVISNIPSCSLSSTVFLTTILLLIVTWPGPAGQTVAIIRVEAEASSYWPLPSQNIDRRSGEISWNNQAGDPTEYSIHSTYTIVYFALSIQ